MLGVVFGPGLVGTAGIDGASLLPYEDALYQPKVPCTSPILNQDTTPETYNQPWDTLAWREISAGEWPLWDPNNGFGMPLLGSGQSAPFNPLKLLLAGGAVGVPEAWFLVSRLAVAGIGALLLARALGLGAIASTLVAVAFMGNGNFAYHFHYSDVHALVMLPWLLLAGERMLDVPNARNATIFGATIALTGALGHPEAALYAAAGAVVSVAFGAIARRRQGSRVWACLGVTCLLAIGLSCVTLLPFLELVHNGNGYMFDPQQANPARWYGFRAKLALVGLHLLSPTARPDAFTFNAFAGIVPLGLAPLGWRSRALRPALSLVAVSVTLLILGYPGRYVPLVTPAPDAGYVPALIAMAVALLAGGGLQRLESKPWGREVILAGIGAGTLTLASGWLAHTAAVRHLGDFRAAAAAALIATLTLLLVRAPRARALTMLGVTALELGWCLHTANPPQPPFAYPSTPILRYLADQPRPFRVTGGLSALLPNTNVVYGIDSLDAEDAFHSGRYAAFMSALLGKSVPASNLFALYVPTPGERPLPFSAPLLDLANVRYVLDAPDRYHLDHLRPWLTHDPVVMRQGSVTLYRNPDVMPRAFVAYSADYTLQGVVGAERRLAATPSRWLDHALIETPGGLAPRGYANTAAPITPARVIRHGTQSVSVEATLPRPGWLILTDAFYPGWQARVDGAPATIYPADVAFRGVYLPAGRHRVDFRYAPRSFRLGLWVSLAFAAFAALLLVRLDRVRFGLPLAPTSRG
ncbi:MAG TPA: YfhO family protein [Oscillatoriaceae cyanobacterium]